MKKKNIEEIKKMIIEKANSLLIKNTPKGKRPTKKAIALALATAAAGFGIILRTTPDGPDVQDNPKQISRTQNAVVKYVRTNEYSDAESNIIDNFDKGRIIEYTSASYVVWNQDENRNVEFIKVKNVIDGIQYSDDSEDVIPENINRTSTYEGDLYVLRDNIDEYVLCTHVPELNFRLRPDLSEKNPIKAAEGKLYVCIDGEGIGKHNFKKALLINPNGSITHGYVADENKYLYPDIENLQYIGIANDYTYLRNSPELPEYKPEHIIGSVTNGEILEILDETDDTYYECKLADSDSNETFYVMKKTVIPFEDFDCDAQFIGDGVGKIYGFADDGSVIERKKSDGTVATVSKSDVLKVDYNSSKGDLYSVYDAINGVVGYMDGSLLRETVTGLTIDEICYFSPSVTTTTIGAEQNTQSQTTNTTTTTIDNGNISQNNKMVITLDSKVFSSAESLKKIVEYYEANNVEVGGVYFSIGSSYGVEVMEIPHIKDSPDIYSQYVSDRSVTSIQKVWDEIKEKSGIDLVGNTRRGSFDNLSNCIEYLISKNIPVGLYYYNAELDETEVSCAAGYCYGLIKCLNEYCPGYRNYDKKLPFGVDIEHNESILREKPENVRRGECAQRFVELLGDGIKTEDASKYFCVDGKNPSDGYNVIPKEKGCIIYGDIRGNGLCSLCSLLKNGTVDYDMLVNSLKEEGYNVNMWATAQLSNEPFSTNNTPFTEKSLNKVQDLDSALSSIDTIKNVHKDMLDKSAILQCMLGKYLNSNQYQSFDVSLTTKENIYNLTHDIPITKTFTQALESTRQNDRDGRGE